MAGIPSPVAGLTFRPSAREDAPGVHRVMVESYDVDRPQERETLADVEEQYDTPWWDAATDGLVAVDDTGAVRAYAQVIDRPGQVRTRQAFLFGAVAPPHRGQGVGRALLGWQVERGRERLADGARGDRPVFLRTFAEDHLADRNRLLGAAGFEARRWYTSMRRDLARPLPETDLPAGLRAVTPEAGDTDLLDRVRRTHNDAFAGHWGSEPFEPDDWRRRAVTGHGRRPDLSCAVLAEGGEVVAYQMSGTFPDDWEAQGFTEGWTDLLGVAEAHRGRGLGRWLLLDAMRRYAAEGLQYAGLGVDVDNPRALALYTGLGYEVRGRETSWVLDL
ncbi:GNAT family N-acetyltransferase [Aquipuribacter sp. SD81]|uniref:GNAT family N-acetyltransferase n=1 Tax=Aquipuribacter sp. SD81 TaxID=3127703 RepID=UPI0030173DC1